MLRLFIVAIAVQLCHTWTVQLNTTHTEVYESRTKNVTISCCYSNNHNHEKSQIIELNRILIRKGPLNVNAPWFIFAKVYKHERPVLIHQGAGDISVSGQVDDASNSCLSVTWSKPSHDTPGNYSCEVNGFSADDSIVDMFSETVSIVQAPLEFKDLLKLFFNFQNRSQKIHTQLQREITDLQLEIDGLRDNMTGKGDGCVSKRQTWPGGRYALLKAADGCPTSTTSPWLDGYVKLNTESGRYPNNDSISDPSHMATPVLERDGNKNFFYIRTCSQETDDTGPAWPKGNYCIIRLRLSCPTGFNWGYVQINTEDTDKLVPDVKNGPSFYLYRLYFCCRHDGESKNPISLPVDSPFFLFRYRGQCQEVANANVTEKWFTADTEDYRNKDATFGAVPDVTINPVHFTTCFYKKRH